jgi:hypothetical protein
VTSPTSARKLTNRRGGPGGSRPGRLPRRSPGVPRWSTAAIAFACRLLDVLNRVRVGPHPTNCGRLG